MPLDFGQELSLVEHVRLLLQADPSAAVVGRLIFWDTMKLFGVQIIWQDPDPEV